MKSSVNGFTDSIVHCPEMPAFEPRQFPLFVRQSPPKYHLLYRCCCCFFPLDATIGLNEYSIRRGWRQNTRPCVLMAKVIWLAVVLLPNQVPSEGKKGFDRKP